MATHPRPRYWTYEDLFDLPDDGRRYEIIEGVLYEMPAPNLEHAVLIANLIQYVFAPVVWALGGKILTAPVEVFLRGPTRSNPISSCCCPSNSGTWSSAASKDRPR